MHQFHKFILSWNSTCFGQFVCPSSGVYSLYTQQWYMSYRFGDSKAVYKPVWHIPLLSVQWINSWWRTDELSETCRVSWQNKFVKLVHLVGFITKKSILLRHAVRIHVVAHVALGPISELYWYDRLYTPFRKYRLLPAYAFIIWNFIVCVPHICEEKILSQRRLECNFFWCYL